jgi:hypothetical protein
MTHGSSVISSHAVMYTELVFGVRNSVVESMRFSNRSAVVLAEPNARMPRRMPAIEAIWMLFR